MTNQASEDELRAEINTIIFARFYDIPDKQRSTIVKNLQAIIRTEKLKLLAEVRERVVGEDTPEGGYTTEPYLRAKQQEIREMVEKAVEHLVEKRVKQLLPDKVTMDAIVDEAVKNRSMYWLSKEEAFDDRVIKAVASLLYKQVDLKLGLKTGVTK